jgi:hypothetical protein
MFLDRFRKKKKEELKVPSTAPTRLPEDLEKFRVGPQTSFDRPIEVFERPSTHPIHTSNDKKHPLDKTDLILQKLDTIDARLRFIEEKLKRF